MGCGLELGILSLDIIVSCQRCSYSSGGVVTVSLSLKIFFDCFISSLELVYLCIGFKAWTITSSLLYMQDNKYSSQSMFKQ